MRRDLKLFLDGELDLVALETVSDICWSDGEVPQPYDKVHRTSQAVHHCKDDSQAKVNVRVVLDLLFDWDHDSEHNQLKHPQRNYDDGLNGQDKDIHQVLLNNKLPCLTAGDKMTP